MLEVEQKVCQKKKTPSKKEKELLVAQEEELLKKLLGTDVELRMINQEKRDYSHLF